eukprot:scaffold1146_cov399-Prasinococcus_capsulatus_cf.AAC.38
MKEGHKCLGRQSPDRSERNHKIYHRQAQRLAPLSQNATPVRLGDNWQPVRIMHICFELLSQFGLQVLPQVQR